MRRLTEMKPSAGRPTALERAAFLRLALAALAAVGVRRVLANHLLKAAHRLLKIVLPEDALLVDDEEDAVPAGREQVVLERRRPEVGVDDVAGLVVRLSDPLCKFERVGDRRREEDVVDRVGQEDDRFLPDDAALCRPTTQEGSRASARAATDGGHERRRTLVAHVMDLVVDDPRDLANNLAAAVEHASQNLRMKAGGGQCAMPPIGPGRQVAGAPRSS